MDYTSSHKGHPKILGGVTKLMRLHDKVPIIDFLKL